MATTYILRTGGPNQSYEARPFVADSDADARTEARFALLDAAPGTLAAVYTGPSFRGPLLGAYLETAMGIEKVA